jgi:hypothetical protein
MRLAGVIPEIAKGLDPFIAAEALELDQEIAGTPEAMMPGDSVTRTVVASVDGVLPMFLPKLLPETKLDGIAIYPDEPVLAEKINRGEYGGEREERVTMVAEGGTSGDVPAISLNWYNLKSGRVEIARVDGFAISVDGPPATGSEPPDWRAVILAGLAVGIGLVMAVRVFQWIVPIAVARYRAMREDRLNSEAYAYGRVRRTARSRDYAALLLALDVWAEKIPGPDPRKNPELREAVIAVGAVRYSKIATADGSGSWRKLYNCLADVRRASKAGIHAKAVLPPLNRVA